MNVSPKRATRPRWPKALDVWCFILSILDDGIVVTWQMPAEKQGFLRKSDYKKITAWLTRASAWLKDQEKGKR